MSQGPPGLPAFREVRPPFLLGSTACAVLVFVTTQLLAGPPWTLLVAACLPVVVVPGTLFVQLCCDYWRTPNATQVAETRPGTPDAERPEPHASAR